MRITKQWFQKHHAPPKQITVWEEYGSPSDPIKYLRQLTSDRNNIPNLASAAWLIARILTAKQTLMLARSEDWWSVDWIDRVIACYYSRIKQHKRTPMYYNP
jgi:hypothetical protein